MAFTLLLGLSQLGLDVTLFASIITLAAAALFLQIVDEPAVELPVPETDYSFAKLVAGQAEGDYRALQDRGRTVLRVRLGQDAAAGLETLVDTVSSLG